MGLLSSPYLLGFEDLEALLDRLTKTGSDSYPPYNIERIVRDDGDDGLRITLAVAGFSNDDLNVVVEEKQLVIRGRQNGGSDDRVYLHRGIAARQFQRIFVLVDGIEVVAADLRDGLLSIDLERPEPQRMARRIEISSGS